MKQEIEPNKGNFTKPRILVSGIAVALLVACAGDKNETPVRPTHIPTDLSRNLNEKDREYLEQIKLEFCRLMEEPKVKEAETSVTTVDIPILIDERDVTIETGDAQADVHIGTPFWGPYVLGANPYKLDENTCTPQPLG